MAATIPAALKPADIARFAQRAGQLEKAKPVVAYWCNYWIVNQILSKGLHNSDDESMTYTMHLMDKLEQSKADHHENYAIADDLAGQTYVEQFGTETLSRAENAMKLNKATRQTADTFLASATFLELCQIWGPLDPEIASKIKYAKYHAVRIARAIKAGEDPNLSNPAPVESPAREQPSVEPDVQLISSSTRAERGTTSAYQPSVEDVPDAHDQLEPHLAQRSFTEESLHPSRAPSASHIPSQDNGYQAPHLEEIDSYYNQSARNEGLPLDIPQGHENAADDGGYFPIIPDSKSENHSSIPPQLPSEDPSITPQRDLSITLPDTPSHISAPLNPHQPDIHRTISLQSFPPPNMGQPLPSDNPPAPFPSHLSYLSHPPPSASRTPPQPPQPLPTHHQPLPKSNIVPHVFSPTPPTPPQTQQPQQSRTQAPYLADEEAILAAQKHARWAISALNFEDVTTAVKELRGALQALGAR